MARYAAFTCCGSQREGAYSWSVVTVPEFYVFEGAESVEALIGNSANTLSWVDKGVWRSSNPGAAWPSYDFSDGLLSMGCSKL